MSFSNLISMISKLSHERTFVCPKCGRHGVVGILSMYVDCPQCSTRLKLRGYGAIGDDVEDVVDAVLAWMGSGATMDAAMKRKEELDRSRDAEQEAD
jgi:DNA-directed RNA polymerase subunit RPC12/RpoP